MADEALIELNASSTRAGQKLAGAEGGAQHPPAAARHGPHEGGIRKSFFGIWKSSKETSGGSCGSP